MIPKKRDSLTIGSLFSGVGGIELGLERAGLGPVLWQVEVDPFCRGVLKKHWPKARQYEDVRGLPGDIDPVDLICGGFPCQPHSVAGKRSGVADLRWLWPTFAAAIARLRPRWVVVENVPGLRTSGLADVLRDLAQSGYDAEWRGLSAVDVGALHLRKRLFIVAYPASIRRQEAQRQAGEERSGRPDVGGGGERSNALAHANGAWEPQPQGGLGGVGGRARDSRLQIAGAATHPDRIDADGSGHGASPVLGRLPEAAKILRDRDAWSVEPEVGRVASRVPGRVAQLRSLGNAVVPQCAEAIGLCIRWAEEQRAAA